MKSLQAIRKPNSHFLLNQFQATDIKIAFANAIGKVGSEAQISFTHCLFVKISILVGFLNWYSTILYHDWFIQENSQVS